MKSPPSIHDKSFVYRNSVNTDIRQTFARIRREMAKQAATQAAEAVVEEARTTSEEVVRKLRVR